MPRPWHASRTISQDKTRSKYEEIKDFLIKTFSPSRWERVEQILTLSELGDRSPSAVINYMTSMLGDFRHEILMQQIFLKLLPTHVQDTLAASNVTDLEGLSERVDQIMACPHHQAPSICNVHHPEEPNSTNNPDYST